MSFAAFLFRQMAKRGDARRDAGLVTPEDIERFDDISYGPHGKWNLLDVYRPAGSEGRLPVIINIHGGGWVYGDKELYQHYCMSLAQRGFAVVNFTYRLAPKYKFPAQLEDVNRVTGWVFDHADEFALDTENIFLVGDSAGGHMTALYTCICTNPEYAAHYSFAVPKGFVPRAVGLNCGVYHMAAAMDANPKMQQSLMRDLLGPHFTRKQLHEISPCFYVTEQFPPAFVMTSTGDFLKGQPRYILTHLKRSQVPYRYRIYGTEEKLLPHVFHCDMRSEDARVCNDEECAFFRQYIQM